ncbi:hypothetical protein CMZ84_05830 [Lysobacteraceae bacterium NML93-0399]|nr:hypothetical protein CMZ84_05830 [Xanthomonadaceae bacterium NML93-0399]
MEFFLTHVAEIVSFLIGAASGSLATVRFKKMKADREGNSVDQSGSSAGGDIVGRDKFGS